MDRTPDTATPATPERARQELASLACGLRLEVLSRRLTEVARRREPLWVCGPPGSGRVRLARAYLRLGHGCVSPRLIELDPKRPSEGLWSAPGRPVPPAILIGLDTLAESERGARLARTAHTTRRRLAVISERSIGRDACLTTPESSAVQNVGFTQIELPPLRERRAELPLLAEQTAEACLVRRKLCPAPGQPALSRESLARILGHDWPGELRELESCIERATRTVAGVRPIEPGDLGLEAVTDDGEDALLAALRRNRWNATRAARELGISRTTVWRRMKGRGLLRSDLGRGAS